MGKTTLARELERATGALRLTPDEWTAPLFGHSDAGGKRDVLEGRLIWVAHQALRADDRRAQRLPTSSAADAVRELARLGF